MAARAAFVYGEGFLPVVAGAAQLQVHSLGCRLPMKRGTRRVHAEEALVTTGAFEVRAVEVRLVRERDGGEAVS
jgi:hypothetical protein